MRSVALVLRNGLGHGDDDRVERITLGVAMEIFAPPGNRQRTVSRVGLVRGIGDWQAKRTTVTESVTPRRGTRSRCGERFPSSGAGRSRLPSDAPRQPPVGCKRSFDQAAGDDESAGQARGRIHTGDWTLGRNDLQKRDPYVPRWMSPKRARTAPPESINF
jgi:hypothetical protein